MRIKMHARALVDFDPVRPRSHDSGEQWTIYSWMQKEELLELAVFREMVSGFFFSVWAEHMWEAAVVISCVLFMQSSYGDSESQSYNIVGSFPDAYEWVPR